MKSSDLAFVSAGANHAFTEYLNFTKVQGLLYTTLEFAEPSDNCPRDVTFELAVVVRGHEHALRTASNLIDALFGTIRLRLLPHFTRGSYVIFTPADIGADTYRILARGNIHKLRNIPTETTK